MVCLYHHYLFDISRFLVAFVVCLLQNVGHDASVRVISVQKKRCLTLNININVRSYKRVALMLAKRT